MDRVEIGIVDTRNVINSIKEQYNIDFKNYALTFFKHRIEKMIYNHNLRDADQLIAQLKKSQDFFETFIQEITVDTTELFRDPSLWRIFRDEFILDQIKKIGKYKIWIAGLQSGEELYSMAIILEEANLWDKIELYASYESEKNYEIVKKGQFNLKKVELNEANYKRINSYGDLKSYYQLEENHGVWDTSLLKNVNFTKQSITFDYAPKQCHLIWFRNQMIYFNHILQEQVLNLLHENLISGGHLIIGDKESLEHSTLNKNYKLIIDTEKIYKKL